jgi:hypothetical protein
MPVGPPDLFWVGLVPLVTAAAFMFACGRFGVRSAAAWAASVGAGIAVGKLGLDVRVGWHTALEKLLRPHEARDWLPWLVLTAAAIGMLARYAPQSRRRDLDLARAWVFALAAMLVAAIPARLLAGSVYVTSRWSWAEKLGVLALWSTAIALAWWMLAFNRPLSARQSLVGCGLAILVTLGMAATLALSGSIVLGKLCGLVAAALVGAVGAAYATNQLQDATWGSAAPLASMLGSLVLVGYFFNRLSATNAALLAVSLVGAIGWLPKLRYPWLAGWGESALRAVLSLVPLAIAVATAWAAATADMYR